MNVKLEINRITLPIRLMSKSVSPVTKTFSKNLKKINTNPSTIFMLTKKINIKIVVNSTVKKLIFRNFDIKSKIKTKAKNMLNIAILKIMIFFNVQPLICLYFIIYFKFK